MPSILQSLLGSQQGPRPAKGFWPELSSVGPVEIIDIRSAAVESRLGDEIYRLLRPQDGPRKLPTLLLYDDEGLRLFERVGIPYPNLLLSALPTDPLPQITYLEEYYLTNAEIQVLQNSAAEIAQSIPSGSLLIELGSGNLRKIELLLQAFEDAGKEIDYYALDLSEQELMRTLAQLPPFQHVRCHGLLGTYDDGQEWLKSSPVSVKRKCVMHMGSSIGNFSRSEATSFLRGFMDVLQPHDSFLIAMDACSNPSRVFRAYNALYNTLDEEGLTHEFVLNGLKNANKILNDQAFKLDDWKVIGEYVYDDNGGYHRAFVSPIRNTVVMGETIRAHERIQIEQSLKFSKQERELLWGSASALEASRWMTDDEDYGLHLLIKNPLSFSLNRAVYAQATVPLTADWKSLWAVWANVTRQMLPNEELLDKPIKLRNACIFYLGHIPAFLDIQLTKTTKQGPTSPSYYHSIFERGIDPDVDNPEHCHAHSEIPDEWPALDDILAYQNRVRDRLHSLYRNGPGKITRDIARAIWVAFEHEAMHMETLLYMMIQSDKTLPPAHVPAPNFEELARVAKPLRVENKWFDIPEQDIVVGLDDPERDLDYDGHFGWDNEKPARKIHVHTFQAKGRPITNEEYAEYLYRTSRDEIPASWAAEEPLNHGNGANGQADGTDVPASFLHGKAVRTVYGLVPLKDALDWPVWASYDELASCAAWMGGRIPTFDEARSIYAHVDLMKRLQAEKQLGATVPAVNGHLVNDGVEETPPSPPDSSSLVDEDNYSSSSRLPSTIATTGEVFLDLTGANVGFQQWHPTAITGNGGRLAGQGEMGGVWEWTSTALWKHEGFEPMALYPLYTADFFDGKHNIVLGGSWATHPRIAGRKSFMNWYQRNYPYAWCGARLVRDIQE
ncbi:DUF323 domain protein [Xylariaceae sp. FL0255]|nr:DUF323 domain protein [Xylariaceae sp. FL0255]